MHSFAQAQVSPEAQAAPQAFLSIQQATNTQMQLYQEQQTLALTMQEASTALGQSIRQSERDQAQNQEDSAIGSIVNGGLGTLAGAASAYMSTKGMYGVRDDEASLENAQNWQKKLTDIQQNPEKRFGMNGGGQALQENSQTVTQRLRAADKTQKVSATDEEDMSIVARTHADEYNGIVQNTKDTASRLRESIDEKRQKIQTMAQSLNTIGQGLGELASGGANMAAAEQTREQADQDIIRNADQTATESIKSVSDSIAQGAQSIDGAKQSIVQTLLQGLAAANAA